MYIFWAQVYLLDLNLTLPLNLLLFDSFKIVWMIWCPLQTQKLEWMQVMGPLKFKVDIKSCFNPIQPDVWELRELLGGGAF